MNREGGAVRTPGDGRSGRRPARLVGCDLQAALLREDTAGFLVLDAQGRTVASASLPA